MVNIDGMLTVKDLAVLFNVSTDTIYDQWRVWGLKGYKIGKHLRFKRSEVLAWLDRQQA
jgi:excisionase family DNA binding protein